MKKWIGIIALTWVLFSCAKEKNRVQEVAVNFNTLRSDPRLSALNSPGGAVTIAGHGVAGLIIYRKGDGGYVSYDRCSTVNPEKKNAVTIDDVARTATDPASGAKFSLEDGSPVKAPATVALKRYQVIISGNNIQVVN